MLLSLNHISYACPSPRTHSSSLICPIPKTLIFEYRSGSSNPSLKFLVRSSSADNPQTLPHSAIQRIADKLRSLGFTEETETKAPTTAGEIFIPLPNRLPKYRVGQTLDPSWSTPENPVPVPGSGKAISRYHELRREVKREREAKKGEGKVPSLAELSLPNEELRRLRTIGIAEKRKLKVGKAGITEGIVNGIHERWRRSEVVKIVCEDLCRMNMKRTHDLLERKTGGLVVWRVGSKIVLYRGADYKYPYFLAETSSVNETSSDAVQNIDVDDKEDDEEGSVLSAVDGAAPPEPRSSDEIVRPSLVQGVGSPNRVRFQLPGEAQLTEEADHLLDGLGPRFNDWWGYDPLPVDADLLPAVVSGYRRPFRLLPYGVSPTLTNDEMTTLKRLSRPLPCHFALGRNTKHQGLAASIVKLWEKCEIAKIAVKRGVQNTNSELMAQELKWLTGGTLLSRDREFIVLYRGKDFLPSAVSSAIEDRRKRGDMDKRWTDCITSNETSEELKDRSWRTTNAKSTDEIDGTNDRKHDLSENKNLRSTDAAIKRTSIKLSMALEKKAKAEKLLSELEKSEMSQQPEIDKEGITEEERYMLRKIGLKMKPFLLMGRRGVFDGTIENMHLHWKYRELVKIICKEKSFQAVQAVARTLEAESGGILVAVEGVSKGYAIILYRGKNYTRPACLRPPTLLSKRQAMKRSLEAQRRESLKLHVLRLTSNIDHLKLQLVKDKEAYNVQCFDESKFQVKGESEEPARTDSELKPDCHSYSTIPADCNVIIETRDEHGADSTTVNQNDSLGASANHKQLQPAQRSNWTDRYPTFDGNRTGENEPNSLPEFSNEKNVSHLNAKNCVSFNEEMGSSVKSAENQSGESVPIVVEEDNRKPSSVVCLSNRDRLLLRKQALKMKNRPVLAVGRSNIVTGVAKTIKAHFQRHPFAIVNVKGRAKGTSVQEVVSKLEEATGAVLVSQEPSKVILYRGWGAGEPGHKGKENKQNAGEASRAKGRSRHAVSLELMEAIRLECGLQHNHQANRPTSSV
ncbi:PREDICTED: chloroplastic group IIA intron splicing facilitator CRS1, chloroplastic [Populus euphratica]|uniref:Chloroplastic group IIA intron splicing facilitator CRS1, chloroplastic n=1 Tax=Populus euphratica TaxID=75702 RepID=A0AAJ6Y9Q9_POPEU|nr:PREDICTED: chloroplastic group IIA intron splicing facilitator CRS1, chloroplastic [Populus euphratica]